MPDKNGSVRACLISARLYSERGTLEGSILDITERKRAEAERLRLEQQLAQAQRLESLGLLAGGIAQSQGESKGVFRRPSTLPSDATPSQQPLAGQIRLLG